MQLGNSNLLYVSPMEEVKNQRIITATEPNRPTVMISLQESIYGTENSTSNVNVKLKKRQQEDEQKR